MAVLGHVRAVRAAGGAAAALAPARGRRPGVERGRLRPRRVRAVRPRRRGPHEHRDRRAPPNRTLFEVLEELERQPGLLRLSPASRAAALAQLVGDLRALRDARPRAAGGRGPVRVPPRLGLARRARRRTDSSRPRRQLANIARFFDIVRAQSALLADDRAVFLARHLQTLIEAGDDPADRRPGPRVDAVARHDRAQGQGPRVPGRVPAGPRRRPVPGRGAARAAGAAGRARRRESLPEGDGQLQEERRLFYVGDDPGPGRADPVATPATTAAAARGACRRSCSRRWTCPSAAATRRRRRDAGVRRSSGWRRFAADEPRAASRRRSPIDGAADAQLLGDRRLPHLPAQVPVRPRRCGSRSRRTTR